MEPMPVISAIISANFAQLFFVAPGETLARIDGKQAAANSVWADLLWVNWYARAFVAEKYQKAAKAAFSYGNLRGWAEGS